MLTRWNPIREMLTMQGVLDRMLETPAQMMEENARVPLDVHETDNAYEIWSALPGVDPESIQVRLHDGVLTISATAPQRGNPLATKTTNGNDSEQKPARRTLVQENFYGHYARSIRLPENIEAEMVTADYENGMLMLTLPKIPKAQPKQIPISLKR
jgi:HSP20 family protein